MGPAEMERIGDWIADVLEDAGNETLIAKVREQVRALAGRFPIQ
jgi:glycine/serine hydroxymethyltransferase